MKNYSTLCAIVGKDCEVSAVLKADAYGVGAKNIAPALAHVGCKTFFVANIDEALELKKALDTSPGSSIYVLHGCYSEELINLCDSEGINVVLNTLDQIELYNKFPVNIKAILHIDTGMTRLGISEQDLDFLIREKKLPKVEYIMSHLSSADKKECKVNEEQLAIIQRCKNKFSCNTNIKLSLSNSAGIFLGSKYHCDMVRPGCALYGVSHKICDSDTLASVINLDAYIIQRRILSKDQYVGYGGTYNAKAGSKLFTLDIGYADGYPRTLSNRGKAFLLDYELDVIGAVSMDSVVIDATCVPDDLFHSATHVELIGNHISVDDISLKSGVLGYELIIGKLGNRFKRSYIYS